MKNIILWNTRSIVNKEIEINYLIYKVNQAINIPFNNKWLNVLVIYNPCNNILREEIEHYSNQLQEPKLIMVDLNAHHPFCEFNLNPNSQTKQAKMFFIF